MSAKDGTTKSPSASSKKIFVYDLGGPDKENRITFSSDKIAGDVNAVRSGT